MCYCFYSRLFLPINRILQFTTFYCFIYVLQTIVHISDIYTLIYFLVNKFCIFVVLGMFGSDPKDCC